VLDFQDLAGADCAWQVRSQRFMFPCFGEELMVASSAGSDGLVERQFHHDRAAVDHCADDALVFVRYLKAGKARGTRTRTQLLLQRRGQLLSERWFRGSLRVGNDAVRGNKIPVALQSL